MLFVCVKNAGKSQIAAALMRALAGDRVEVFSAGTRPGGAVNSEAEVAVSELGASMQGEAPKQIDPGVLARVDRVVVLGSEAVVEPAAGMVGSMETWETDEPSTRGIAGMERMRMVRDDIAARVEALFAEMVGGSQGNVPSTQVRVYEPALCCNSGVCGPELDQDLVTFTADLDFLQDLGVDIARHNLANDPGAFAADPSAAAFLKVAGSKGLPLVLVDGVTVAAGRYPTRDEVLSWVGFEGSSAAEITRDLGLLTVERGCCGDEASVPASGCCTGASVSASGCC